MEMLMFFVCSNSSKQNHNFLESQQKSLWDIKPFISMYTYEDWRNCSFVQLYIIQIYTFFHFVSLHFALILLNSGVKSVYIWDSYLYQWEWVTFR